jgi:hypothetical protein
LLLGFSGMDIQGGYDSVANMRKAGNNHGKVVEISHAGVSRSIPGKSTFITAVTDFR